jgi:molybdate transport system regulatory protein
MEMSYRRAWLLVDDLKSVFGEPLVETAAGGAQGGGAALTRRGREVLAAYRSLEKAAARAAARAVKTLTRTSRNTSPLCFCWSRQPRPKTLRPAWPSTGR